MVRALNVRLCSIYILPQLEKKVKGLPLSAGVQGNHFVLSFIWPKSHKLGFYEFSDGFCEPLSIP